MLFSKEERNEMKGSHVLRDYVMEQEFDLLTYFYPNQLLTLDLTIRDIQNIMDCDSEDALILLENTRRRVKKGYYDPISVADFCSYKNIDDLFIHLFLASLRDDLPAPPIQEIAADRTNQPLRTMAELKEDLRKGIIIHMPLALYDKLNPLGEPMAKRDDKVFYRCVVRAPEVAQVCGVHIDTARAMLRLVRQENNMRPRAIVSIEKFCQIHYMPEKQFRKSLASIHGEKYEDD